MGLLVMINKDSGFTMVELLVSMVILMIGLLGMLQGINLAMSKNMENVLRNEALLVADEAMMLKRAKPFESLSTISTNLSLRRFTRGVYKNYSISEVVSLATQSSKEIKLEVNWKYKNQRYTHSLSTFISSSPK